MKIEEMLETVGREVIHFSGRTLIIILVIAVLTALFRSRWSASRLHSIWALCMGAILFLPLLYGVFPRWKTVDTRKLVQWVEEGFSKETIEKKIVVSSPANPVKQLDSPLTLVKNSNKTASPGTVPPPRDWSSVSAEKKAKTLDETGMALFREPVAGVTRERALSAEASSRYSFYSWIGAVWLLGIVSLGGLYARGRWGLRNIGKRGSAAGVQLTIVLERVKQALELKKKVTVVTSREIDVPFVYGVWRPKVLLPSAVAEMEDKQIELILKHELIHIKRGDTLALTLSHAVAWLHWVNPLMWWIVLKEMEDLREYACDNWVLEEEKRTKGYAQLLLGFARRIFHRQQIMTSAMPMAHKSGIDKRITHLLSKRVNRKRDSWAIKTILSTALALCLIPMFCIKLRAALNKKTEHTLYFKERTAAGAEASKQFSGELLGIENGVLRWEHPGAWEEMEIDLRALEKIELGKESYPVATTPRPTLIMTNGDRLVGEILSIDTKEVTINIAGMGEVRVDRSRIERWDEASVEVIPAYRGPQGVSDWRVVKPSIQTGAKGWHYEEGAFHFQGRDRENPHAENLSWEKEPRKLYQQFFQMGSLTKGRVLPSENFVFTFDVFSREKIDMRVDLGAYFSLFLSPDAIRTFSLYRSGGEELARDVFTVDHHNVAELGKGRVRCKVIFDHEKATLTFFANEKRICHLTEIEPAFLRNKRLGFAGKLGSEFTLQNLAIYPWEGEESPSIPGLLNQERDQLFLSSGRRIEGFLESMNRNTLVFQAEEKRVMVDFKDVREVYFAQQNRHPSPPMLSREMRTQLVLQNGSKLYLELDHMGTKEIRGRIESLGRQTISMPRKNIAQLVFHYPHREKVADQVDTVFFTNGDQLRGKFEEDGRGNVFWKGGPLLHKVAIRKQRVHEVALADRGRGQ